MSICAILLAAGASSRMQGRDKLVEIVRGQPLLRDRAEMLLASDISALIVVLPKDKPARMETLEGLELTAVINADAASGMASSIAVGLDQIEGSCRAALIMPADMPDITSQDINTMLETHTKRPARILRATDADGTPASPVIFPRRFFASLQALKGEQSGRAVLQENISELDLIALPGTHATCDLDTPEDWKIWRQKQSQ